MISYLKKNCVLKEGNDRDYGSFIIKMRTGEKDKSKQTSNGKGSGFGTLSPAKRKTPKSRITGLGNVILLGHGTLGVTNRPARPPKK